VEEQQSLEDGVIGKILPVSHRREVFRRACGEITPGSCLPSRLFGWRVRH